MPNDLTHHQAAFSCTPIFDAACHALLLRHTDLQQLLPSANTALNRLHESVVQERINSLRPSSIEDRLAACILHRISNGRVFRCDVANDLCMSERTLQRRLVVAGTSFQKELDALLSKLAQTYLSDQSIPLKSIAPMLGFVEESTFYRACHRWFKLSPKQARADALTKLK
jgi:AraC-like DNA-binding protein